MNTSPHVSLETLADIEEGRARPEVREAAMTHVATCLACDNTLQNLRRIISLMRGDTTADVPHKVLMSAIKIFSPQRQSPLPRFIATLIFDSLSAAPAFGMRSLHSNSRQLLYSAQETDLDLRITIQNDECVVAGQIIRESCAGGVVEISGTTGMAQTSLNELCEFTFPAIPVGHYLLRIWMPDVEIEISTLELMN